MLSGEPIPDVTLLAADGVSLPLAKAAGPGGLAVYFYPRADTPGCTREAQDFTALSAEFAAAGVAVVGVSKDAPAKLARFADKHGLGVTLASDPDGAACEAFGTWGEKQMYGRTYHGIERATFLFGADGRLVQQWRKVKVAGHAQAVLDAARAGTGA